MLGEFSSVQSIYQYCGCHRNLLLRAKESQDPSAVGAFFSVYGVQARQRLLALIYRERVSLIVLPRVSVRRISSLNWHPADFWKQQIASLEALAPGCLPSVHMVFPTFERKQAFISSDVRRLRIGRSRPRGIESHFAGVDISPDLQRPANDGSSVLFLDDVLTSGGTLLREFDSLTTSGRMAALQQPVKAHILTLFRTPVRSTSESHDS
jgi:hypothetical protein